MSMSSMYPSSFCNHVFTEINDRNSLFSCGACKTAIAGKRLSCTSCGFSLHPFCRACPPSLSSALHPEHALALVTTPIYNHNCDVCFDPIEGAHYTCHVDPDLRAHPLCAQVLPRAHHVLEHHHPLELQRLPPRTARCNVCHEDCHGWAYRCGACAIDIHLWCLLQPSSSPPPAQLPSIYGTTRSVHGPDRDPYYNRSCSAPPTPLYFGQVNYSNIGFDMSSLSQSGSYPDGTMTTTRGPIFNVFMRIVGSLALNLLISVFTGGAGGLFSFLIC